MFPDVGYPSNGMTQYKYRHHKKAKFGVKQRRSNNFTIFSSISPQFQLPHFLKNANIQSDQNGKRNDTHDKKIDPYDVNLNVVFMLSHERWNHMSAIGVPKGIFLK